jgi:hypothetical protein
MKVTLRSKKCARSWRRCYERASGMCRDSGSYYLLHVPHLVHLEGAMKLLLAAGLLLFLVGGHGHGGNYHHYFGGCASAYRH